MNRPEGPTLRIISSEKETLHYQLSVAGVDAFDPEQPGYRHLNTKTAAWFLKAAVSCAAILGRAAITVRQYEMTPHKATVLI